MNQTGRGRRSGRWLAVTGLIFVVTFTFAMVLLAQAPGLGVAASTVVAFYANPSSRNTVLAGAYLAPVAGIFFFWFMGVLRSREGPVQGLEASFSAAIAAAGGTVFVGCLFVAAAAVATPAASVAFLSIPPQNPNAAQLLQELGYIVLLVYGTRAAAAFMIFSSRLGVASRSMPRWLGATGILLGLALLIIVSHNAAIFFVLPLWVGIVSLYALVHPTIAGVDSRRQP